MFSLLTALFGLLTEPLVLKVAFGFGLYELVKLISAKGLKGLFNLAVTALAKFQSAKAAALAELAQLEAQASAAKTAFKAVASAVEADVTVASPAVAPQVSTAVPAAPAATA